MDIVDFSNCCSDSELFDGKAGQKKSVIYNDEKWIIKFGKTTKSMKDVNISYTNSPLCEYIGSNIYRLLGIDVHETKLGLYRTNDGEKNKEYLVVGCKNFKKRGDSFYSFLEVLNNFDPDTYDIDNDTLDLDTVIYLLENNDIISKDLIMDRFWKMFIVDALINNNDRHFGNFGVIENNDKFVLAPVYDNGASFYNKLDNEKARRMLNDKNSLNQSFYHSRVSVYSKNGVSINPYKYIESMVNKNCNKALLEIFPLINIDDICKIIDNIPEKVNDLEVLPFYIKELFKESIKYGYDNILKKVYIQLCSK